MSSSEELLAATLQNTSLLIMIASLAWIPLP